MAGGVARYNCVSTASKPERNLMIKELVKDDAVLSVPCEPATAEDAPVAQDLVDTLASIEDAVCLAANQIGVATTLAGPRR